MDMTWAQLSIKAVKTSREKGVHQQKTWTSNLYKTGVGSRGSFKANAHRNEVSELFSTQPPLKMGVPYSKTPLFRPLPRKQQSNDGHRPRQTHACQKLPSNSSFKLPVGNVRVWSETFVWDRKHSRHMYSPTGLPNARLIRTGNDDNNTIQLSFAKTRHSACCDVRTPSHDAPDDKTQIAGGVKNAQWRSATSGRRCHQRRKMLIQTEMDGGSGESDNDSWKQKNIMNNQRRKKENDWKDWDVRCRLATAVSLVATMATKCDRNGEWGKKWGVARKSPHVECFDLLLFSKASSDFGDLTPESMVSSFHRDVEGTERSVRFKCRCADNNKRWCARLLDCCWIFAVDDRRK